MSREVRPQEFLTMDVDHWHISLPVWSSDSTSHFLLQAHWICVDYGMCGLTVASWGNPAEFIGDCLHLHCQAGGWDHIGCTVFMNSCEDRSNGMKIESIFCDQLMVQMWQKKCKLCHFVRVSHSHCCSWQMAHPYWRKQQHQWLSGGESTSAFSLLNKLFCVPCSPWPDSPENCL